ncbi:MAG: transcriptional regulator, partial [Proteobacteria bacterium]
MRLHITCPNCETPAKGYKTRKLSSVVTEVAYNCTNP